MSASDIFGEDAAAKRQRMIKTIEREIAYRHRVYPRLVANGRMSRRAADEQIDAMTEVLAFLKGHRDG